MSVLLNDIFFPQTDPLVKAFIPALSFCSTHLLRPFGAFLFGYFGDWFGRRSAIIISVTVMSCCCVTLAALPTYQQIGITAPIVLTLCRMVQGMSASAEMTGAEIYVSESVKPPAQYPMVSYITLFSAMGSTAAIGAGFIFTNYSFFLPPDFAQHSWRFAFLFGSIIGIIGAVARRSLKEAAEFANGYKYIREKMDSKSLPISATLSLAFFAVQCARPPCIYFLYMHCGAILKDTFGFTPAEVMLNNFWITLIDIVGLIIVSRLSYSISPLKIVKTKLVLFTIFMPLFPIALNYYHSCKTVFIFQVIGSMFLLSHVPASPMFFKYFPLIKRFRYVGVISAFAKLGTYFFSSFGLVVVVKYFGQAGALIILAPIALSFFWSIRYFEQKEIARGEFERKNVFFEQN